MITAHEVQTARFRRAAPGAVGYDEVSVDEFLDRVVTTLDAIEHGAPVGPNGLTSAEVVDTVFPERSAQVNGGYDLDDVDDLLDRVAQRLFGHEQQLASRGSAQHLTTDGATTSITDEGFTRADDGGVADARALAAAEAGDSLEPSGQSVEPTEVVEVVQADEASLDSRESDVAGAVHSGVSFAAEDDVPGDGTSRDHDVEEAQAPTAAEPRQEIDVEAGAGVDERPMHVIFDSADSREPLTPRIDAGVDEPLDERAETATADVLPVADDADVVDRGVDAVHEPAPEHEPASEVGSDGVNPVGAEPVDDTVAPSPEHAPVDGAAAETVHPVGSSADDAGELGPERDAARLEAFSTAEAVDRAETLDEAEFSDAEVVSRDAPVTPEERFDATRRDDVVNEPTDVDVVPKNGSEFEPVDAPRQRATDEVHGEVLDARDAERFEDGFDPFGDASSTRAQGDSAMTSTVGESWAFETPVDAPVDSPTPVGLTTDDQSEPEIVSYRATDHRVPLPRGDVRSHLSDADLEAESHYHPEFSTYAGQSDGVEGAAEIGVLEQEPVAPESSMPAPEPEPVQADHDAREDVEVHGPGRSDASSSVSAPMLTPVERAQPQGADVVDAGRAAEQDDYVPTHFVERAEPSAVPAMRDVTPVEHVDTDYRPEPIDRPASIDVDEPEAIERPSALPPRDDTSRKGILRRIFKG